MATTPPKTRRKAAAKLASQPATSAVELTQEPGGAKADEPPQAPPAAKNSKTPKAPKLGRSAKVKPADEAAQPEAPGPEAGAKPARKTAKTAGKAVGKKAAGGKSRQTATLEAGMDRAAVEMPAAVVPQSSPAERQAEDAAETVTEQVAEQPSRAKQSEKAPAKAKSAAPKKVRKGRAKVETEAEAEIAAMAEPALLPMPPVEPVEPVAELQHPEHSEILLQPGALNHLVWRAGSACPQALREAAQALADADGRLPTEAEADAQQWLPALLALAAGSGHELRVAPAVWTQLSWARDMRARTAALLRVCPAGPEDASLKALMAEPLAPFQWEAALFSVCVGRALLVDVLGWGQHEQALAAWQLWRLHLGVEHGLLVCEPGRLALWQEALAALPPAAERATLELCTPSQLGARTGPAPELLIVDEVSGLADPASAATLAALRALGASRLLLLGSRELLSAPELLAPLVDWLDDARRGPWAALSALLAVAPAGESPGPRALREALQTVMLSRRRRDLTPGLPRQRLRQQWVSLGMTQQAEQRAGLMLLRAAVQRWQRLGDLGGAEQLQMLEALQGLRLRCIEPAAPAAVDAQGEAFEAKTEAVLALLPQIVPALAARVVICAQSDLALAAVQDRLDALGLATLRIGRDQPAGERNATARAWCEEGEAQGQVLLLNDRAAAGLTLWSAAQPLPAIVHLDLPWNPRQLDARVLAVGGPDARGVQGWQLLASASVEQGLWLAQRSLDAAQGLPAATLDGEAAQPFLEGEALTHFMGTLHALLDAVGVV